MFSQHGRSVMVGASNVWFRGSIVVLFRFFRVVFGIVRKLQGVLFFGDGVLNLSGQGGAFFRLFCLALTIGCLDGLNMSILVLRVNRWPPYRDGNRSSFDV